MHEYIPYAVLLSTPMLRKGRYAGRFSVARQPTTAWLTQQQSLSVFSFDHSLLILFALVLCCSKWVTHLN